MYVLIFIGHLLYPVIIVEDVKNMPTVCKLLSVDESQFVLQTRASGWFKDVHFEQEDLSGDLLLEPAGVDALLLEAAGTDVLLLEAGPGLGTVISLIDRNLQGLNSEIDLGLFRYVEARFPDEMGEVLNVTVGAGFTPVGQEEEDWNIDFGEEDWNGLTGEEDWGVGIETLEIFDAFISPTNDGRTVLLDEFDQSLRQELTLIESGGAQNYYDCQAVGVYHIITINALASNKTFHLKSLELSGNLAGRL